MVFCVSLFLCVPAGSRPARTPCPPSRFGVTCSTSRSRTPSRSSRRSATMVRGDAQQQWPTGGLGIHTRMALAFESHTFAVLTCLPPLSLSLSLCSRDCPREPVRRSRFRLVAVRRVRGQLGLLLARGRTANHALWRVLSGARTTGTPCRQSQLKLFHQVSARRQTTNTPRSRSNLNESLAQLDLMAHRCCCCCHC